MRRFTPRLCLFLIACINVFALHAQTDVTATYLINTDFETDPVMATVDGTQPADHTNYTITGWTTVASIQFKKLLTLPYTATAKDAFGVAAPSNGSTVQDANSYLLGIKTHWLPADPNNYLEQTIALPIGKYYLTWDSFVRQTLSNASSMCGIVIDGVEQYKPMANAVDTWANNTLEFTLSSPKSVTIRFGYKKTTTATGGTAGGTDSPVLFVDNVKLSVYTADKTSLDAKMQEVQSIVVASSPGEAAINAAIASAMVVYNNAAATSDEILQAINALDAAKAAYTNTSLTDLKIDAITAVGFAPATLSYNYTVSPSQPIPSVVATPSGALFGAVATITDATSMPGATTVTVTAGNGDTKVYTVNLIVNLMGGWDANGSTTASPHDAGWRTTDAAVIAWANSSTINSSYYQYRDNLGVGRTFIHPANDAIFSYPVPLAEGKIYTFSCSSSKMSGGGNRPTTFAINTFANGTGTILGSDNQVALQWSAVTNHSFNFVTPADATYYMTWQTKRNVGDNDRGLAYNFMLVEVGNAIKVLFEPNNASTIDKQYLLAGSKVAQPTELTKDGSVFAGWYTDQVFANAWDFENNTVSADITLYAKWDAATSISTTVAQQAINVFAVQGGVKVVASKATQLKVVSALGQVIKTVDTNAGETFISLPAGMYIVNGIKAIAR